MLMSISTQNDIIIKYLDTADWVIICQSYSNVVQLREYSFGVSIFANLLTQDAVAARFASVISPGLWPKESIPAKNISAITILNFLTMLMLKVS